MADTSNKAQDKVEKAITDALSRRAELGAISEEEDEALITATVESYLAARAHKAHKPGGRVSPAFVAIGLLAAAAAFAVWWLPTTSTDVGQQVALSEPNEAMWVAQSEHASVQGTALRGSTAATDIELCGLRDNVRACLTPGSRAIFGPHEELELQEGTLRVETQGPSAVTMLRYSVASSDAAQFTITTRASDWTVSVEAGSVTLTGPDGSRVLGADESVSSRAPDRGGDELVQLDPPTQPAASTRSSDEQAPKLAEEPSVSRPKVAPTKSAEELLKLARSQRAAKEFREAARTYEQLLRAYPKSKKVPATLVSLAQLYQGPLKDPAKALRHFDHYLKRGGPLAEEASYGRIRALRSLGRNDAARSEADAFLRAYPGSAYADALGRN